MIPGLVSKMSESRIVNANTIAPKTDVVYITGSGGAIKTIVPPYEGFSGLLFLVATIGSVTADTTGNIGAAITFVQNKVTVLVYSKVNAKWWSSV